MEDYGRMFHYALCAISGGDFAGLFVKAEKMCFDGVEIHLRDAADRAATNTLTGRNVLIGVKPVTQSKTNKKYT
jgi:hypothetical protein